MSMVIEQVEKPKVKVSCIDKTWIQAGKAIFTIEPSEDFRKKHPDAKPHYTFMVKHKEANGQWKEQWFISLLTKPNNESEDSYTYVGKLNAAFARCDLTAASKYAETSWAVMILNRVLKAIWQDRVGDIIASGWSIHHEGICARCGRKLTVPQSVEDGYGPECVKMMAF